jgi:endonuclease/exonuclease/phosphatase family metal-dependent hydrolase
LLRIAAAIAVSMGCTSEEAPTKSDRTVSDRTVLADSGVEVDSGELPQSGALSVLSYNVHGLPSIITGDDTPARIEQIAPLLVPWDLAGLQEDWDATHHATLVGQTEHPVKLWFDEIVSEDRFYGSGLSVLSVLPVIDQHFVHYTTCYGILDGASDCLASKGFQAVRLKVGAGEIDFYNTHLEAGGGDEDNAARAVQVEQVIASLNGWSAGKAIVFTGDFNLHADDPEDAPLLDRLTGDGGLQDACVLAGCDAPNHIDKVFIRSRSGLALGVTKWTDESAAFLDADGVDLSDHPPISAVVTWAVTENSHP